MWHSYAGHKIVPLVVPSNVVGRVIMTAVKCRALCIRSIYDVAVDEYCQTLKLTI